MDAQEALALVLTGAMLSRAGCVAGNRRARKGDTRPPAAGRPDGAVGSLLDAGEGEST